MGKRGKKPVDTICWECDNALLGCCWSRAYKPVPGWTANATRIKTSHGSMGDSYAVIACPEFKEKKR